MGNPTEVPVADASLVTHTPALPATADRPDTSLTSKSAEDVSASTPSSNADSVGEKQEAALGGSDAPASDSRVEQPLSNPAADGSPVVEHYGTKETAEGDETQAGENKQAAEGAGEETADGEQQERKYMSGLPLALLTFGLCMATFVIALDNTIIATAIPRITTVFNSLDDVGWYGSSYLLTTTSLQPSFGKIYAYFDVKWTFLFALTIFEAGSVICAAARNSPMFIVGRAVAGAGAAAIFSGGMTIVAYSVPLHRRAMYIASLSSMFGISSVIGPILGGALTDKASWRWCFWINLPVGGIALATVFFFFKNPERQYTNMTTKEKIKQIDIFGAVFLIGAIVCLLLALQWGGTTYPWHDSKVWGNLLGFGLLIITFSGIQVWRGELATLPPRILVKQRTVMACAWFSTFLSMSLYTHIYYLPFYFQAGKGTTAEGSGIRCIAYLVSITCSSIVVGGLVTVFGYYTPFLWFGTAVFTIGCGFLSTLKVDSSAGKWIGYQILTGAGAGACVQIPFVAVQVVLSEKDMPTGNAIAIFFNTLGGAVSISAAQNIFSNTLQKYLVRYAPNVNPLVVIAVGATHLREKIPAVDLPGVIKAYVKGVDVAFILPIVTGALAFGFSLLMEWKSVKGKSLLPGGAA